MKKLRIIPAVIIMLASVVTTGAQTLQSFKERIFIGTDGHSRAEWTIEPGSCKGAFSLPVQFDSVSSISLKSSGAALKDEVISGSRYLTVLPGENFGGGSVKITFDIHNYMNLSKAEVKEFGNIQISYKFVNISAAVYKKFSSEIILPEKYLVAAVDKSFPELNQNNPEVPYDVISVNSLHGVVIRSSAMKLGDNVLIQFKVKKEGRSYLLLAGLMLLAAGYLYFYRDVLKDPATEANKGN